MIAQAMAKKNGISMLSISSGDVYQKNWGEDEKVIRAAFSLARKIHPCVMFVDEADGILGSRRDDDKKHITSMLNEFLREWDGASAGRHRNPFVLLSTNMPWNIDPAVLRRAPLRIPMNLPTMEHRKEILKILLCEETLGDDISIETLATFTRAFSGSDLKNLCVNAALNCIEDQMRDDTGTNEAKRTLCKCHFDLAFTYVKPSGLNRSYARRFQEFNRGH